MDDASRLTWAAWCARMVIGSMRPGVDHFAVPYAVEGEASTECDPRRNCVQHLLNLSSKRRGDIRRTKPFTADAWSAEQRDKDQYNSMSALPNRRH